MGRGGVHARASGDSEVVEERTTRRPWGRTAAYPWRGPRGTVGHPPHQTVQGERGNHPASPSRQRATWAIWEGPPSAEGVRVGHSPRSSPRTGKPSTWRRGAAGPQWKYCNARRSPVNTGAPQTRVLEMQTKLHQWAGENEDRRFDDLY